MATPFCSCFSQHLTVAPFPSCPISQGATWNVDSVNEHFSVTAAATFIQANKKSHLDYLNHLLICQPASPLPTVYFPTAAKGNHKTQIRSCYFLLRNHQWLSIPRSKPNVQSQKWCDSDISLTISFCSTHSPVYTMASSLLLIYSRHGPI